MTKRKTKTAELELTATPKDPEVPPAPIPVEYEQARRFPDKSDWAESPWSPTHTVGQRLRPRITMPEYAAKMSARGFDTENNFYPDPTVIAPPVGFIDQPSMFEVVRSMVHNARLQQELDEAGAETFEESDDFDVGDEDEAALSGYENDFEPDTVQMARDRVQAGLAEKAANPPPESPIAVPTPAATQQTEVT